MLTTAAEMQLAREERETFSRWSNVFYFNLLNKLYDPCQHHMQVMLQKIGRQALQTVTGDRQKHVSLMTEDELIYIRIPGVPELTQPIYVDLADIPNKATEDYEKYKTYRDEIQHEKIFVSQGIRNLLNAVNNMNELYYILPENIHTMMKLTQSGGYGITAERAEYLKKIRSTCDPMLDLVRERQLENLIMRH